jgi:hypothetical protein
VFYETALFLAGKMKACLHAWVHTDEVGSQGCKEKEENL